MKVLIIGRGGREHALALKVSQSPLVTDIYVAPGNDGMSNFAKLVPISETDTAALVEFGFKNHIDLTIAGPAESLLAGVSNKFREKGLKIFSPTWEASLIEGSKSFAKTLINRSNLPTGHAAFFDSYSVALSYLKKCGLPSVIKFDKLAAGRGVFLPSTMEEAEKILSKIFEEKIFGSGSVIIEEFLDGYEFTLMALVHGEKVFPMEAVKDYKRAYDGSSGPNTGGMGSYSPVTTVPQETIDKIVEEIMVPIAGEMVKEGCSFTGFLYAGMVLTKEGPKILEFNARLGDPEAQVLLPRLESDLVEVILAILEGKEPTLKWKKEATVGVVVAADGYPDNFKTSVPLPNIKRGAPHILHYGTELKDDIFYSAKDIGRVLTVLGEGNSIEEARKTVYERLSQIESPGVHYRTDIATNILSPIK